MSKIINLTTVAFILCITISLYPVKCSISRWFSSSYTDLQVTLRRYGHCVGNLSPLKEINMNETEYLIHKMKIFLNEANLDNDQLLNVTGLMDNLCRPEPNADYPISVNVDVNLYNSTNGKQNRCRAIDEAMDAMFYVFKRASQNKSEPLDFSVIQYYPNSTNTESSYNLTDLINTSWIKSDTQVEHICKITDAIKEFVVNRSNNQTAQDRSQKPIRPFETIMDMIDFILEPLLGLQKRIYWEGNNRFEIAYNIIGNQLANLRDGLAKGYKTSRQGFIGLFVSNNTNKISFNNTEMVKMNETLFNKTTTLNLNDSLASNMINNSTTI